MQYVRICGSSCGDVLSPGEQGHVRVTLIREFPKMLVAPNPSEDERTLGVHIARAPYGLFVAEVHLERRCQVE